MLAKLREMLRPKPIPRASGVSDRIVVLGLGGRFMDELMSGLPNVLLPTIRAQLGLTYTEISLLSLSLNYVAAVVEPISGLLIDVWRRRRIMAFGAAGIGLATMVMGAAPTFWILLLGFAIYGLASGPLAHTGDVVLIEAHPTAPGRIYARSTLIDTLGALLAPLLVTVVVWLGLSWRWLLLSVGFSGFIYAGLLLRTRFPAPAGRDEHDGLSMRQTLRGNVRLVLANRNTRFWLLFLFLHMLAEAPEIFTSVWLREQVGMSQGLIGLYLALEMAVGVLSLLYLDRWLVRWPRRRILQFACLMVLALYPAWLFVPGIWARFLLGVPLNFFLAVFWPVGKAASLASTPGKAGTVTAMHSLFGFVPLTLFFGLLAEQINLTPAMLWVTMLAFGLMLLLISFGGVEYPGARHRPPPDPGRAPPRPLV